MTLVVPYTALIVTVTMGFALLALSQKRNWRETGAPISLPPSIAVVLRVVGFTLIVLGLPLAVWQEGAGFGALLWSGIVSVSACAITFTLSWRPRWLRPVAMSIHAVVRPLTARER